jgi:hypothetical protein
LIHDDERPHGINPDGAFPFFKFRCPSPEIFVASDRSMKTAEKRVTILSQMLDFCGIEKQRLRARWVSSVEAPEFIEEVNAFVDVLKKLGPSPLKKEQAKMLA